MIATAATKVCNRCNKTHPVDFFRFKSKPTASRPWRHYLCKKCENAVKYQKNKDKPGHKTRRAKWMRENRKKPNEALKARARAAVGAAIQSGKLQRKPCEVCGAENVEAHHTDYSKPLQVRWLCHVHHKMEHGLWL